MKHGWKSRSRRFWPALGFAAAGDLILATAAIVAGGAGYLKTPPFSDAFLIGAVATVFFFSAGYLMAARALAPVRETVQLTRHLASRRDATRFSIDNPHDEIGELEMLLNELLQRLEGSFVELDRLAADVSHELRTPLMAMRTVGEVALRDRNPAILYDAVGKVRRMNQLIDRLLLLTRGDSDRSPVRPKPGPVRSVLLEVSETLQMVAEDKQQSLEVQCPDNLKAVFDPALLRLALMNLAQDAIRYSIPGKPIVLRGRAAQKAVWVEVADQGPGIAPEHHQKIFQRFYRVDDARSRAQGGVGLGLAIVKWAVERMGGAVELESGAGRGTVFRLRLVSAPE